MATKSAKRRARRDAQFREIPSAPLSPDQTSALAASGTDINRGNSDKMPMSDVGIQEVREIGRKLNAKGGLDSLKTSGTVRGNQTAEHIAAASSKPLEPSQDGNLSSWAQGNLEGQPMADVKGQIRDLIRKNPSQKIPGQGAMSSKPGESFDDFRTSRLSAIRGVMQELAQNPAAKIGRTTHSQVIKLIKGWTAKGTPDDLSIDHGAMEDEHENPGGVARLFPSKDGEWELKDVNMDDQKPLETGIYLIRHGATPWNRESYQRNNGGMDARAAIAKATKSMDFQGVKEAAAHALQNGHLSEDDISSTVDASLPNAKDAADLPNHHLLAVASIASPAKRKEYEPIVRRNFASLSSLPPDAQHILASHLGRIGMLPQSEGDLS